ncbi:VWA domain-containing protein [Phytohabitans houttuyneae]|uniref:VWFA domain-containing protein n=1 Tax=Phytohabitans houttuyneae TaxID=1076126 RepID=A0A6V8KE65_9ACTN|nr:VWA domain-containing protein [Phytohabitans houttuyneae]GFJ82094.1 hypothetical protein Phou_062740 [Phytohabitans houttuyneae]
MSAFTGLANQGLLAQAESGCLPLGPSINTDVTSSGSPVHGAFVLVAIVTLALAVFLGQRRGGRLKGLVTIVAVGALLLSLGGIASADVVAKPKGCVQAAGIQSDLDGDGLPDENEKRFGSDPQKADTDGDGLSDTEEVRTVTLPTKADSDGDGLGDAQDDTDQDSLSNLAEVRGATNPSDRDTDEDGLEDGAEPEHHTSPINPDTDGDGVKDGDEVKLGSDPLKAVKNEQHTVKIENKQLGASASVTGPAGAVLTAQIVSADTELRQVPGAVGAPVGVVSSGTLTSGTLTYKVAAASLPAGDLAVLHYDEKTGQLDRPLSQSVDRSTGIVSVTTKSFSPFVLVDIDEFEAVWKSELDLPRAGSKKNIAAMLALDSSGSMLDNDPQDLRKSAAKQFVDALVSGDLAGGVDFDSRVAGFQPLTSDFQVVKSFVDSIDSNGGTDIGVAVDAALDEMDRGSGTNRARIIVLLTDGDGSYTDSLTTRAANSKTIIYTVGLGSGVKDSLLQDIADKTGGKYFKIDDAGQLIDAYEDIAGDIGSPDSDGDGLSDKAEQDGWRTQRGAVFKTDAANADTDGDGLSDGEEAGAVVSSSWGKGYVAISDPTRQDTDADGIDDLAETPLGTSLWSADTDTDGLSDKQEYDFDSDPTNRNIDGDSYGDSDEYGKKLHPMEYDLTGSEATGAAIAGFVYGDWEWGARNIGRLNDAQLQSFQYLAGQFASGVAVIGDVRDFLTNAVQGDFGGAALSAAGLIPVVGDGAKVGKSVAKFARRGAQAAKAAYRYVYELPVSHSLKRKIAATAVGDAAKVLPKALEGGPARTVVYRGERGGKNVYVGITVDPARRQAQHGGKFDLIPISGELTRGEARAIEQSLIVRAGGPGSSGFLNKINSISPKHYYYEDAVEWGEAWLKAHNITYP